MKNQFVVVFLLITLSSLCYGQKSDSLKQTIQKNELKFNLLSGIEGKLELTYERIVRKNMGLGSAMFVALDRSIPYKFGFTSYYRLYFGKRKYLNFFVEANTGVLTLEDEYYDVAHVYNITTTNLTLGVAVGLKYATRNGFFLEAYFGGGKLVADRIGYVNQDFARNGIVLGKRF